MVPVSLAQTKTKDDVLLHGIVVEPKGKKKDMALLWLHGLSSRFYSGQTLITTLSAACQTRGIGYFKFNTRGHDIVNRDTVQERTVYGAAFERFEDCSLDIKALIQFIKRRGYKRIILAGHSTGANKALYYMYTTGDRAVSHLLLLGPVSDVAAGRKAMGASKLSRAMQIAASLKKKNESLLMPLEYGIYSAERFWRLHQPGGAEDVFPYYDPKGNWTELKSVRIPLAVVLSTRDEYIDRPAEEIMEAFQKNATVAKSFTGMLIKNAGHGFKKKERELTHAIMDWIGKSAV